MTTVKQARITVLVENHTDMLLTDTKDVKRFGMAQHFAPPYGSPVCTENGIAYWIELRDGDRRRHILFDTGLTPWVILRNFKALGLTPDEAEHVVISHGHPDHFGGLLGVLKAREKPVPVAIHPDAFLPKLLLDEHGDATMRINRGLDKRSIEEAGGVIVETKEPLEIGPGALVTGEIERNTPFEPPVPTGPGSVFLERDGQLVNDDATIDDQAVILNVEGKGLVVLTACGHSGIINTIRQAQRLTGVEQIYAIMGGFHLGFPGVPAENAEKTVEELKVFEPTYIAPMHCSGLHTQALCLQQFPDQFLHNVVGTTLRIDP